MSLSLCESYSMHTTMNGIDIQTSTLYNISFTTATHKNRKMIRKELCTQKPPTFSRLAVTKSRSCGYHLDRWSDAFGLIMDNPRRNIVRDPVPFIC
jgi:hypothetical protein